jgi:FKBP-type peptidyl-prolyl cis-trans isomerase (trigger factor)
MRGMAREEIASHEQQMRKELAPQARSQVKTYLVLAEIARKEKIPVDEHVTGRAMEFLLKEAAWKVE